MTKEETVKICPNCSSTDIVYATQPSGSNLGGGNQFYCRNCEYGYFHHVLFIEAKKSEIKKIQEETRKLRSN